MPLAAQQLDRRFLEIGDTCVAPERPARGWIKAIREALGMTTAQLAKRMGVPQPRIAELEKREAGRIVTLRSLERAAEALDCRLIYILVPNDSLEDRVNSRAEAVAEAHLAAVDHTMRLEKQSVTDRQRREAMKKKIVADLLERPARLWQLP
ncbi:MAG: mobile mystery protein A [Hyphomonadaceae bacterium]|nr:mobile mystery protein A [Hyphomonadaceae bacterium]